MVTSPSYSFRIVSTPSFIIFIKAWHEIVLELYQDSKVSLVSPFGHPLVIEVHHLISLILLSRGPDMFRQDNLWEFFSVNQNNLVNKSWMSTSTTRTFFSCYYVESTSIFKYNLDIIFTIKLRLSWRPIDFFFLIDGIISQISLIFSAAIPAACSLPPEVINTLIPGYKIHFSIISITDKNDLEKARVKVPKKYLCLIAARKNNLW